jgi:formylglycine-generating enzyme required for sulfatase activity
MRRFSLMKIALIVLASILFVLPLSCGDDDDDDGRGDVYVPPGDDDLNDDFDDDTDDDSDDDVDDDTDDDTDDDADDDTDDDVDDDTYDMAFIPAGNFWMGCEPEDEECLEPESSRHEVWLSAYYIDINEVTYESYAEFLTQHGNQCTEDDVCVEEDSPDLRLSESDGVWSVDAGYENHPMNLVSWLGAVAYCEVHGKRLPTSAEWEKAGKGAAENYIYPWGDIWIANAANYEASGDPFDNGPTPVGYYDGSDHGGTYQTTDDSSPFGLHDVVGNVSEWVYDWFDRYYYDAYPPDSWPSNPQGPELGLRRIIRGGNWYIPSEFSRVSFNSGGGPPEWHWHVLLGFRCARD